MEDLKKYLLAIVPFSNEELEILLSLFSRKKLTKNEYIAKEGEFSMRIAFISEGVIRAFYRNTNGNEYNKFFFTKMELTGAYSSLVSKERNLINLQCLTNCTLLTADFSEITKLYDKFPKIERLARVLAEQFFVAKEKREIEIVMLEATERYRIFQNTYPELENLIPQYHIASYLGITPTQLSRIRAKK